MRDRSGQALAHPQPSAVISLKVWYSRVPDWGLLAGFANLQGLEVAGYADRTLEPLSRLNRLEHLRLLHFPNVHSLEPLANLVALKTLALESLPSYDAAGKYLTVESLAPLASLQMLRDLRIFGVRASDASLRPLSGLTSLDTVHIGRGFPSSEYQALQSALPSVVFRFPASARG